MNRAIKKLLSVEPRSLKALNETFNIDWNKPYKAVRINDNTTIKQCLKTVKAERNDLVLVLNWIDYGYFSNRFRVGVIDYNGGLEVKNGYSNYYFHAKTLDNYYCKGDFREDLKNSTRSSYHIVIAVDKKNLNEPKKHSFDYSDRYRFIKKGSYFTSLLSISTGVKCEQRSYNNNYVIDKSGYIVSYYRDKLEYKAKILKAKREKAMYLASDNSKKVEALRLKIKARKLELIELLKNADTYESIKKVSKSLESWGCGLASIQESFERMERGIKEKSYSSIDDFNRHYERINEMLLDNERN